MLIVIRVFVTMHVRKKKVLIILRKPFLHLKLEYMVICATWRCSHLQHKGSNFIPLLFWGPKYCRSPGDPTYQSSILKPYCGCSILYKVVVVLVVYMYVLLQILINYLWFSFNLGRQNAQWWNEQMLVDKQSELISDLLFTVHQRGGDDVTWKPPIICFW